jgi:hypothetical protein
MPREPGSNVRIIDRNRNIQWAAIVMSREIELHAEVEGDMDQRTVERLSEWLQSVARGENQAHGLSR